MEAIASRHGQRIQRLELSLFNLRSDPGETKNVAADHRDVVARLSKAAESIRTELGDALTDAKGTALRAPGIEPATDLKAPKRKASP
jgi:hypothetical protein